MKTNTKGVIIAAILILLMPIAFGEFVLDQNNPAQNSMVVSYQEQNGTSQQNTRTYSYNLQNQNQQNSQNTLIVQNQNGNPQDNNSFEIQTIPGNQNNNNFVVTHYSIDHDFSLISNIAEINLCSCSRIFNRLVLQNTGSVKDTYDISVDKDYIGLSFSKVSLESGQYTEIVEFLNPGCDEFSEDFTTTVTSTAGISKELTQTLNLQTCNNINASVKNTTLKTNPCVPVSGKFTVENPLNFPELYHFDSDILNSFVSFSENPANISPGKTKQINFTYSTSCDVFGDYNGNININTEFTGIKQSLPLNLSIQRRYRFDVSSPSSFETCNNLETWIPITIKNNEKFENTFRASMPFNLYFKIRQGTITVAPNSSGIVYIIAKPNWRDAGDIYLPYTIISKLGNIESNGYIIANVSNCHKFNIMTNEQDICSDEKQAYFTLQNIGTKEDNFSVEANGVSLKNKIIVEPNDTVQIDVPLNISDNDKTYSISLKVKNGYFGKNAKIFVNVKSLNSCYRPEISMPKIVNVNYMSAINNITISNNGDREERYTLSLDAPLWAEIKTSQVNLSPGKSKNLKILTSPGNISGDFKATLTLVEIISGQNYYKTFIIRANGKPFMQKIIDFFHNSFSFIAKNSYSVFAFIIILAILIIIAIIIIFFRNVRKKKLEEVRKLIVRPIRKRR